MELHQLVSVTETARPGALMVEADVTDADGIRQVWVYSLSPTDQHGLAPLIRQAVEDWIAAGNTPAPYVPPPPPTPEELRAAMPSLTARQLRLGLVSNGIALASVQAAVDAISDPTERELAQVEWEYATTFERTHALISQIGSALSLTPEEIDTMWEASHGL